MGLIRSTTIRSLLRFLTAFMNLSIIGYIAIFLGPTALGTFGLYRTVVLLMSVGADLGLQHAISKRISERDEPSKFFSAFLLLTGILTSIAIVFIYLAKSNIAAYIGRDFLELLVLGLIGQVGVGVINSTLLGENKIERLSIVEFLQKLSTSVTQAILIIGYGYGVHGLIIGELAGFAFGIGIGLLSLSTTIRMPSQQHFRELFNFARHAWVTPVSQRIRSKMDVLVIGYFFPATTVGVYELVWMVSSVYSYIPMAIQTALFPEISIRHSDGKHVEHLVGKSLSYSPLFIVPGIIGALIIGEPLLSLFGSAFETGYITLVLLVVARLSMAGYDILTSYYSGIDRPDVVAYATGILVVSNIVGNVGLVPIVGISGAALATVGSFTIAALFLLMWRQAILDEIEHRPLVACAISSGGMGVVTWLVVRVLGEMVTNRILVVGAISVGALSYGLLVVITTPQIRLLVQNQIGRLL